MAIIYGIGESAGDFASALSGTFSTLSAYAFMVFVLLYTPCVAVIGVVKKEKQTLTNGQHFQFYINYLQAAGNAIIIPWALFSYSLAK